MMIVSFAWTIEAIIQLLKTQSRRFWDDNYAKKFKKGKLIQAYTKNPRAKGKKFAILRLTCDAWKQKLNDMTQEQFIAEGGTMYWKDLDEFIQMMLSQGKGEMVWVVEFELVAVHGEKK